MEDVTQNFIHEDKAYKSFAFLLQLTIWASTQSVTEQISWKKVKSPKYV
jgi:hypothetical protein